MNRYILVLFLSLATIGAFSAPVAPISANVPTKAPIKPVGTIPKPATPLPGKKPAVASTSKPAPIAAQIPHPVSPAAAKPVGAQASGAKAASVKSAPLAAPGAGTTSSTTFLSIIATGARAGCPAPFPNHNDNLVARQIPRIGNILNLPSITDVQCTDPKTKRLVTLKGPDIKLAVDAARCAEPIKEKTLNDRVQRFPHTFGNFEKIRFTEPKCARGNLEEFALAKDRSGQLKFNNVGNKVALLGDVNAFRVVYTTPDVNGDITFCGVIAHLPGSSSFRPDPCAAVPKSST